MNASLANRKPNPYRAKGTGNLTFVYEVEGTPEELAAYKASKGDFHREDKDSKKPLFFTTRYFGKKAELVKSEKGEYYPDTTALDILASAEKQYGWNIAQQMTGAQHRTEPAGE